MEYQLLLHEVIGRAYTVYNKLGSGFLERVYENSLVLELKKININAMQQVKIKVLYEDTEVGFYIPDLIIQNAIVIELKTYREITSLHRAQLQNYLQATNLDIGLILNFGPYGVQYKRVNRK